MSTTIPRYWSNTFFFGAPPKSIVAQVPNGGGGGESETFLCTHLCCCFFVCFFFFFFFLRFFLGFKRGGTCTKRGGNCRKKSQKGGHGPGVPPPPKSATATNGTFTIEGKSYVSTVVAFAFFFCVEGKFSWQKVLILKEYSNKIEALGSNSKLPLLFHAPWFRSPFSVVPRLLVALKLFHEHHDSAVLVLREREWNLLKRDVADEAWFAARAQRQQGSVPLESRFGAHWFQDVLMILREDRGERYII